MSAEFDLSDFDADPTAADHTALLDEIRQAATSGVRSASAPLVAAASEVQRQVKELRAAERSIQAATASITAARSALFWDNAKHLLLYAAVGGLVLGGGGVGYHFVKRPKVETRYVGCTAWNAKTKTCTGRWIPLVEKAPDEAGA
ncbi:MULTISPECIES: hypothetical protein [Brevundimonas]|uniref:hypothetical protein n=1 Tax=Brevundimonas sp. TaxID=1871086 RepID=UPI0028AF8E63|nr:MULTISPECIES: hypothetical protein [Brevundimonas]